MTYLRTNRAQLAVVVVLAGLLFTLAVFQYRWLGLLSDRNHEMMRRNLAAATGYVLREFDGELADIYQRFQVDFQEPESFAEQLSGRYLSWINDVETSDLLQGLYWVTNDEKDGLTIDLFTGTEHLVRMDEWPAELAHLEKAFEDALQHNDEQFRRLVGPEPLHDDILALVVQQVRSRPNRPFDELSEHKRIHWAVVTLNRAYMVDNFIPDLADELYGDAAVDYNVAVIDKSNPDAFVYVSDPSLPVKTFEDPDGARDIFALRWWQFRGPSITSRRSWNVVEEYAEPRWTLSVKHEAGSLASAVAAARNRSLAISLGVLLLLGGSVMMIVVSTRRAQRLAAQQMEFVAGVSHELRTPLAVIRAAGENLADEVVHDPEKTRQYGELINREGLRLSWMVERVLLFAQLRSGRQRFEMRPVDVGSLIESAISSLQGPIAEDSIVLEKELARDLPQTIGDAGALESALQNLISNAVKYSYHGGTVRVRARLAADEDGREVQVAIQDEGEGIPAAEIPHVFEPFFRGKLAQSAQIQGTGLGLSLVKEIVEAHGGEVSVSSVQGRGSTFLVRLPLKDAAELDADGDGASSAAHESAV